MVGDDEFVAVGGRGNQMPSADSGNREALGVGLQLLFRLSKKCNSGGMSDTHVVTNQVPPLDSPSPPPHPVLVEALIREGGEWGVDEVTVSGGRSGSAQAQRWGELANRNEPVLRTHDRYGHRIDEVEFHPRTTN